MNKIGFSEIILEHETRWTREQLNLIKMHPVGLNKYEVLVQEYFVCSILRLEISDLYRVMFSQFGAKRNIRRGTIYFTKENAQKYIDWLSERLVMAKLISGN